VVAGGVLLSWCGGAAVDGLLRTLPRDARRLARGTAFKPTFSVRALLDAAAGVEAALRRGELARARALLGRDLVSRETSKLSAANVAGAAIESVAENFSDSVVAPLLAFRLGGLGGAYAFRFINTADAMLGYRSPELEWFGKTAARLDDLCGIVPARTSALLIALAAVITGDAATNALLVALDCADDTASPNAGWPMAAMAGALGVRLVKHGHYALNRRARDPRPQDIRRARRIVFTASVLAALAADLA
jgi:adenosylcobinamide-phosphate synthase